MEAEVVQQLWRLLQEVQEHQQQQGEQQPPQQQQGEHAGSKRPPPCSPGSLAAAVAPIAACSNAAPPADHGGCSGEALDVLDRLLAAGHTLRGLKEEHFAETSYGHLRLAAAHLGRCTPGP